MTSPRAPRSTESPEPADVVSRAREALQDVTEGPWEAQQYDDYPGDVGCGLLAGVGMAQRGIGYIGVYNWNPPEQAETDAKFIVAARSLIPELIAEVERLRGALTIVRELHRPRRFIVCDTGPFCDICDTGDYPCPTARAAGAGVS